MRGIVPGLDPVLGHLIRAVELCPDLFRREVAQGGRYLSTYLTGKQLTDSQLASIGLEGAGEEDAGALLALIGAALDRYEELVRNLREEDFGTVRHIGRKRYQTTAIGLAIHVVEHAQRHVGGMIAAAKLARIPLPE